ncbi:cyclin-dependent kinase 2-like [Aduncisulcus paluster]|uniref:Cyclin-dependent kinase 2-like n=1 Tax=Aduncisulcus paluster TaxID=2918883 RepID=A0ABQ5JRB3_9EUKA|nr:cyclin-dependent kinase 2-like [Aduncisulcus paluster]
MFENQKKIGEGTYGVVFRAEDTSDGNKIVAIKKIKLGSQDEGINITAIREIKILQELDHKNIITINRVLLKSKNIYLVMDYIPLSVEHLLSIHIPIPKQVAKMMMRQLVEGVAYLHANFVLHRDLKPGNMLIDKRDGNIKLIDFGLGKPFGDRDMTYTPGVVTPWYRAPEVILQTPVYGCPIDVWSIGCIIAEMITKSALFPYEAEMPLMRRISAVIGPLTTDIWPGVRESHAFKSYGTIDFYNDPLVSVIRMPEDCDLPSSYPYLKNAIGTQCNEEQLVLLSHLLQWDPAKRLTAQQVLELPYFKQDLKQGQDSMQKIKSFLELVEKKESHTRDVGSKKSRDKRRVLRQKERERARRTSEKKHSSVGHVSDSSGGGFHSFTSSSSSSSFPSHSTNPKIDSVLIDVGSSSVMTASSKISSSGDPKHEGTYVEAYSNTPMHPAPPPNFNLSMGTTPAMIGQPIMGVGITPFHGDTSSSYLAKEEDDSSRLSSGNVVAPRNPFSSSAHFVGDGSGVASTDGKEEERSSSVKHRGRRNLSQELDRLAGDSEEDSSQG